MVGWWSSVWFGLHLSLRGFTDRAVNVLLVARKHTVKRHHRDVTPEHILLGLATITPGLAGAGLDRLGLNLALHMEAIAVLADTARPGDSPALHPETELLLRRAKAEARELGHRYVGTEHLVLGLLGGTGPATNFLRERGITTERFRELVQTLLAGS